MHYALLVIPKNEICSLQIRLPQCDIGVTRYANALSDIIYVAFGNNIIRENVWNVSAGWRLQKTRHFPAFGT